MLESDRGLAVGLVKGCVRVAGTGQTTGLVCDEMALFASDGCDALLAAGSRESERKAKA